MRIINTETYDLIVTQAIERYLEMPSDEASRTINSEWQEQMATLLTDFLFRERCRKTRGLSGFVQVLRKTGMSNYIVPFSGGRLS